MDVHSIGQEAGLEGPDEGPTKLAGVGRCVGRGVVVVVEKVRAGRARGPWVDRGRGGGDGEGRWVGGAVGLRVGGGLGDGV